MINKLKQIKVTKKGIYISLAICMLLISGIGIFTSISNMNKIINDAEVPIDNLIKPTEVQLNTDFLDAVNKNNQSEEVIKEETVLDFIMPVSGNIDKAFSGSELVYSETMNDYRTHTGIDISSTEGEAVISAESGKIVEVTDHPLWGTSITIDHGNGYTTCYKNLSDTIPYGVEVGSYVSAGGIIGAVGSSALVEVGENPHLHFEMYVNGNAVDPMEFIG